MHKTVYQLGFWETNLLSLLTIQSPDNAINFKLLKNFYIFHPIYFFLIEDLQKKIFLENVKNWNL